MTALPSSGNEYSVVCPHCSKPFRATLLGGSTARHSGFKCPHCKLFVPFARVEDAAAREPAA